MSTALARVVQSAQLVKPRWAQEAKQLEVVTRQVEDGLALLKSFLPIEAGARTKVKAALAPLQEQQRELRRMAAGLKRLNLEPLTWRGKDGLPLLAIFSLDCPDCRIAAAYNTVFLTTMPDKHSESKHLAIPQKIVDCYADTYRTIMKLGGEAISCRFDGVIPADVKRKIEEAQDMFKGIFIIAEPKSWTIQLVDPDPLVVGWDGESLWLIAIFDATPVEEAMAFTVPGALKS